MRVEWAHLHIKWPNRHLRHDLNKFQIQHKFSISAAGDESRKKPSKPNPNPPSSFDKYFSNLYIFSWSSAGRRGIYLHKCIFPSFVHFLGFHQHPHCICTPSLCIGLLSQTDQLSNPPNTIFNHQFLNFSDFQQEREREREQHKTMSSGYRGKCTYF